MIKKVLVTGGFGFIGKHLIAKLLEKNIEIIILDHPNTKTQPGLESLEIYRFDITNKNHINSLRIKNIDAVLHLAGQSSGPKSFQEPFLDINLNILGTLNIIEFCINNNIPRLLFASSFVVYGDHLGIEKYSENLCCNPKSVYGTSKLACENLLINYAQPKGIKWNSLRMYNVYGVGQDITKSDQGIIGIFMNMMIKSNKIEVKGSLERFRDLVNIHDVVNAWDLCLHSKAYNHIFNVGSGHKTKISQMIDSISHTIGKKNLIEIKVSEGTPGDLKGCYADLNKISSLIKYEPKIKLNDGLLEMWKNL